MNTAPGLLKYRGWLKYFLIYLFTASQYKQVADGNLTIISMNKVNRGLNLNSEIPNKNI